MDQVAYPDARTFGDIFEASTPFERGNVNPQPPAGFEAHAFTFPDYLGSLGRSRVKQGHAEIGGFCSVRGGQSLWVRPRPEIIDYIREHMVFSEGERISFEIVDRGGTALVVARNSQIIGSRWLAFIESATIPQAATV